MPAGSLLDRYMDPLLAGDRRACRNVVFQHLERVSDASQLYETLFWPCMEKVEKLYRGDRIDTVTEHMATRINRCLADQLQTALPRKGPNGKRVLITCADGEPEELGAQMCADRFEAEGWDVYFVGGGVPNDEIVTMVGQLRPHVLFIYGTQPQGVPGVRRLIDTIREIGSNPTMNIMISGGVFNRADGLWKEVNADLHASTVRHALAVAKAAEPRVPEVRLPGAPKKRRRRRCPPLLEPAVA